MAMINPQTGEITGYRPTTTPIANWGNPTTPTPTPTPAPTTAPAGGLGSINPQTGQGSATPVHTGVQSGNVLNDWQDWANKTHPGGYPQTDTQGLQNLVNGFNNYYGYNANATGADTINFPGSGAYDVLTSGNQWWMNPDDPNAGRGGSGYGSGSGIFSDPATAQWEQALMALAGRLQQPQSVPDLGPLKDYMRQYFQQLQGPAYTPDQMDLMRTQVGDPLTQQRDAQQKQIIQRFAAQGVPQSSGIVQKAIQDLNTQYQRQNTTNNANVANQAITVQKQQQGQAAQIGTALATLEQQNNAQDEARALQAVQMLFQIPQLADTRLGLANQTLQGSQVNPAALLQTGLGYSQLGNTQSVQSQQFWANLIAQLAPSLVGAFTG